MDFNGLGTLVNFSNISRQSDLARLFDSGAPLDGSDDFPQVSGDTRNDETVSPAISNHYYPNDGFVVRRADKYYLLRIEGVHLAGNSDDDFYSVSIKH